MEEETRQYRGVYAYALGTVLSVVLALWVYAKTYIVLMGIPVTFFFGAVCLGFALTFFTRMLNTMKQLDSESDTTSERTVSWL